MSLLCRLSTQEVSDSYKTKVHQIHNFFFRTIHFNNTYIPVVWLHADVPHFDHVWFIMKQMYAIHFFFYNKAITFIKPSTFITEINLTLREALAILPSMSWALTSIRMYPDMSDWNMVLVLMIPSLDRLRGALGNLFLRVSG